MQKKSDQDRFKNYLRKIGSGEQTSKNMSRHESADALKLILTGIPSPAQIGAFMIAHRMKRPTPEELAGMVDAYIELGPKFQSKDSQRRPICFGMPFDGRIRTAPIYPLTTLVLITAGQPVVLQGGKRMPVKFGITIKELFLALNINLEGLTIGQVEDGFLKNDFAFIYQPDHFSLAENLIYYREEIGKRPPLASMELLWSAHRSKHLHISGFVHHPTEERHWKALELLGEEELITIKGLEGSIDISTSRISIANQVGKSLVNRLHLNPKEFNCSKQDIKFESLQIWQDQAVEALNCKGPLKETLLWNAGFYLWTSGVTKNLKEGIEKTTTLLKSGAVHKTIKKLTTWRQSV